MTGNTTKVRAVFLAALMVFSVFAGTVAFSGSAAATPDEYNGGAVHYDPDPGDSTAVIEVPFDGPIESAAITEENFTLLDDGDDVSDNIDFSASRAAHDGSGQVELITNGVVNSNELEVELSSAVANNDGEKAVAFAAQTVDLKTLGPSERTTFQGTTIAFFNDSSVDDFEISDADEDEFDYFQSYSTGSNSEVFFFDTSDRDLGDYNLNDENQNLTIRDLGLTVEMDDLNVTTEDAIEGEVDSRASDRAIEVELIDDGGDGDTVQTIGTTTSGQGSFDFSFDPVDDTGEYTVLVTDNGSAVEAESSTITVEEEEDDDASFTENTVSDQRGDIVELTVDIEGQDFATITVGEPDGSEGILANATVEDDDGDGQVTVYVNTYHFTTGDAIFALDDDSDDNLESQEISTSPSGQISDLIDSGEYDLEVAAGETPAAATTAGADGVGTLVLEERNTDTFRMWTGSSGELSPSDLEDVNEAIADGEITQSSEIAAGDLAVHQLVASGFEGALDARENEDVSGDFLGLLGGPIDLTIEEADPGANQAAQEVLLGPQNTTVIADGPNDTYFVIVETDNLNFDGGSSVPTDDDTAFETNFTVLSDDASGLDFTDDDEFDDDENEETFVDFTVAEPDASIDEPFNVSQASGQTISGTTNIAPGSEIRLRVRSQDGVSPSFLKSAEPTVQSDGTFSATFDFSEQSVGDAYDIIVASPLLASDEEEEGTVVVGVATGTATPEPTDTATPEPTDTATPESTDTATPEPTDTATEEPTEEPTSTPTSTPGFGVVVALTALLAAALLAIRRE